MKTMRYLVIGFLLLGSWQVASGAYIQVKAIAAQLLIERAWERTLAGEQHVKPWPWADTWPVARLRYPQVGQLDQGSENGRGGHVDLMVLANGTGRSLAFGPGHVAGSAEPGSPGNTVIGAHRDTHFAFLQDVVVNDRFTLETDDGQVSWYQVVDTQVADAGRNRISLDIEQQALTLVTCYPFDALDAGGSLRFVVTALEIPDFAQSVAATR